MGQYVGRKNDTLGKVARRYGVDLKTIRELNPDVKFGKRKKLGGEGFRNLRGETLRLGKGVGVPRRKAELLQDPKYASFLRQFDYDRDRTRSDFIDFRDRQRRDLARAETDFQTQLTDDYRNIDETMDNRGLYRSGQRLVDRGRANTDMRQARQRYIDLQGEDREAERRDMRETISGMRRKRMEERLSARERLTMRDANTEYGY